MKAKSCINNYLVISVILLTGFSNPVAQEQTGGQPGSSPAQRPADSSMYGWPAYGGSPGGGQYSPLNRIDRDNVKRLEVAWIYHSGDVSDGTDGTAVTPLEVNPVLANDRLYICTPFNRIVALDPGTGIEEWNHDPEIDKKNTYSKGSYCRGVAYWSESTTKNQGGTCNKRVLSGIGDGRLVAVDADTGRLCSDFGHNGQIDLNTFDYHGEGSISLTSPPAIYRDVVIVGSTILDGEWANAPDGIVRGFDVRSGRELWNWNPIPEHLRDTLGGANTWAPPPFTAQSVTADDAWGLTFWDRKQCRNRILALRNEGLFTPPGVNGSVLYPSDSGGSNWGGVAYNPESGLAVVNSTNILRSQKLMPRKEFEVSGDTQKTAGRSSAALMPGTPYVWLRETLVSDFGIPCNPPPWGNLTAIDTSTGKIHWQIPFGRKPFGFGLFRSPKNWGSPNQGGPIITRGGLIFIGASLDHRFRAYDLYSGEELWSAKLPAPGNATPMTYLHGESKRQFIVIAAGGYPTFGTELSDAIVAFSLPE